MQTRKKPNNPGIIAISVLIIFSFTAGCTAIQTLPAPANEQRREEPTKVRQGTNPVLPTRTPVPTIAGSITDAPNPASTPVAAAIGLSRKNPYPRSKVAAVPNWDIQVTEVKRGEEAWQEIQSADPFNEPAPEGMEYLLVRLQVKNTSTDEDERSLGSCDFSVTGDHLINYTCGAAAELEPGLDATLTTGGEAEGWVSYLVPQAEKNLILVFQELFSVDENASRYIALDQGASIGIPPDLANLKPDDLGLTRDKPALRTQKLTTQEWVLGINQVVRGEEAWTLVQEANQFNDPPAQGMEYIAIQIHVRSIWRIEKAGSIDGSSFQSTGSSNILYEYPSVAEPDPALNVSLFPGGEFTGWLVIQAGQGESGMLLVFNQLLDNGEEVQRFISLEP